MNEHTDSHAETVAIERLLLIALCQESLEIRNRDEILRRLGYHEFRDPEHEVLFQALSKVRGSHRERRQPEEIAEAPREVGACLTRLGFPDFDLEPFFHPVSPTFPLSVPEVAALLQRL